MDTDKDPTSKQSFTEPQQTVNYHDAASTPTSRGSDNITPISNQPTDTPKKKNIIWLFVIIGIILITVGIITSYFLIKNNADKAADNYTTSLKSYFIKVYDGVNSAQASPASINDLLLKSKKPELPSAFLSSLSSKYTNAQTFVNASSNRLNSFNALASDFVSVYNYQQTSRDLVAKAGSTYQPTGDNTKYLSNSLNTIKQIKVLADKVKAPSELKSSFADISNKLGDMITAFTTVITAYNTGDQAAINTADTNFKTISSAEAATEEEVFTSYYDGLVNKFIESVKGLKEYANSI